MPRATADDATTDDPAGSTRAGMLPVLAPPVPELTQTSPSDPPKPDASCDDRTVPDGCPSEAGTSGGPVSEAVGTIFSAAV